MTTRVFTIREDKQLLAAREIMAWAHVRHVPVVDAQGGLVGILSHRDILAAALSTPSANVASAPQRQHLAALDVKRIAHRPVTVVDPDVPVQHAAHLMRSRGVGCLPVVANGRLVGIVTATDLLGLFERLPDSAFAPVPPTAETAPQRSAPGGAVSCPRST